MTTSSSIGTTSLDVAGVTVRYGGVVALEDVSLRLARGNVVGLIGPNGAGKTSLINAITGIIRVERGSIALGAARIDRLPQYRIARAGVARTYQNVRLFARLSAADNVRAGALARSKTIDDARVREFMARTGMTETALDRRAGTLPYGEQRRLEIARALASDPTIVLLDEPAAGMNPHETDALREVIANVARAGIGVLLVEHDMSLVRAVCDSIVVLNFGRRIFEGTPGEAARDAAVIEAYLGS